MKKFMLHKKFEPINLPGVEQKNEHVALDNLYSFFRGMMPARYSRQYLLNLGEDDKDIKKLISARALSESNKYDEVSHIDDDTKLIPQDLKGSYNHIESDDAKNEILKYVKEQTLTYACKNIKKYYLKMNAFYSDIITSLDNQIKSEGSVSVDLLAQKIGHTLKNDFGYYIEEIEKHDPARAKKLKNNYVCGVREVHDPLTDKDYMVALEIRVPDDCNEDTPEGKEKFNRFIMANALEPNGKVVILGEVGGKVNPFSHLPIDYTGPTLVTNINIAPNSAAVFFTHKAYVELQAMMLVDHNFLKYVQLSDAMNVEHNAYKHILNAVNQIIGVEPLNYDMKRIEKISSPSFFGRVFSKPQNRSRKIKNYIDGKRTQNFGVIEAAKKVADEFDRMANEKKSSVVCPFPGFDF